MGGSVSRGDFRPTEQAQGVLDQLLGEIHAALADLDDILQVQLPELNRLILERAIPMIGVERD